MDKINEQELQGLVSKPRETSAIQTNSPESFSLVLAGMLQLAASNARYELSESEIEFWKRQVSQYPAELVEKFFSEHIASSKWMPQFADLHEWMARESERQYQEKQSRDYRESQRRQKERVEAWRNSPEYERDMQEIREKLQKIVANVKRELLPVPRREIPLAFSPAKEQEIINGFIQEKSK